jgi:UDP-GlcNAc3NAcA epimerase
MKKIVTVIGARPQFIKASPVSRAFKTHPGLTEILVHTGQHYNSEMSDIFFEELEIPQPKYNLQVGSASHAYQTAEIMKRLEDVLIQEAPDLLLIYGDTNSTLAGAVTATKLHIPVAHIEAGLRSFNKRMPEEINRIVADTLSSLLFVPTATGHKNLQSEGISAGVVKTGDVMYDVALYFKNKAEKTSTILSKCAVKPRSYYLATIHRAENTDNKERFGAILTALNATAQSMRIILPLHPRTQKMIAAFGMESATNNLTIIPPVGFLDMIALESNAQMIVTDSGGVQKEAYFHKVPCVTLRDETEWVETVAAGWNCIVPPISADTIMDGLRTFANNPPNRTNINDYGEGNAAEVICSHIVHFLSISE